jgi:hypothetical protein
MHRPTGGCARTAHIDTPAPQPDQLAPPHAGVDGEIHHRPVPLGVGLSKAKGLVPVEEDHVALGNAGRVYSVTRVVHDLLLLHGDLQHAAQRPVVPVHRARRRALLHFIVEPLFDFLGWKPSHPVGTKPWQHVLLEIPAIRLPRGGRQTTTQRQQRLGPHCQRHVGIAGIEPAAAHLRRLDLAQEPVGVGLAGDRLGVDLA